MREERKINQKSIAVYSEKGGVGKTSILVSLAHKITDIESSVFLDSDMSAQSILVVLKRFSINPKILYKDTISVLPFIMTIHNKTEYFFIDLAGREASVNEITYLKLMNLIIVPIPPIHTNYNTPVHTIEKLLKHGIDADKILVLINYMWPNENLDQNLINEFIECLNIMTKKYSINNFTTGLSFCSNMNTNQNCLNSNSKYIRDIVSLSEFIKPIINKNN
ncbi:chromosome partitioning protein ParA [uncultured bacterium]|uniref:Putative nucleoside triphosphate hydrolase n=1 Tax=uncultured microorganism TaxID=358574 RepID=A0A077JIS7_9ZZZZ|nr:putative nucleoside triphosphate hydrolase [uncultured microorganism]BCL65652.1 chromosome partitioning protein ParA [uncultured bacterium]